MTLGTSSSTMVIFARTVLARMRVRILATSQQPLWLFADVVIPLITISGYIFLYKALKAPPAFSGFVLIGGIMAAFWANILWSMAAQFYWEKETGNLEMYFVSPAPTMAVLLGMSLGSIISTTLRATAILLLGSAIYSVPLTFGNPLPTLLIFILTLIAFYALGMLFASLFMLYGREAWHTANLLQEPVYFIGGFYFPIIGSSFAPLWLQAAASVVPVSFAIDALRKLVVLGQGIQSIQLDAFALIAFILIIIPLSKLTLDYMENLGRKEGRLTLRWQ
ncbi:MAG: ABC transporter permease [Thaumarchaeota archaeon]|nr:ABC transporter permease [Nitrososphaerota archaeon]